MAEPEDMIIPMLREMRAEIRDFKTEMKEGFAAVEKRFDSIDDLQKSFNNAMTADTLTRRLVTGDFNQRIVALEKQVDDLMNRS